MKFLPLLLSLFVATSSWGAVAYDTSDTATGHDVSSITFTGYTITGNNTLLLCANVMQFGAVMSGVTYNSVAMSWVGSTNSGGGYLELWALATGDSPGSHDVVFTVDGGTGTRIATGCASFSGVSQVSPLGTLLTSSDYVSSGVNLTVPANGLSFDVASDINQTPSPVVAQTPGGSQTKRFEDWIDQGAGSSSAIFSSTRSTSGIFNWTTPGGEYENQLGVPINPFVAPTLVRHRGIIIQ